MISAFESLRAFDEAAAVRACGLSGLPVLHIEAEPPRVDVDRLRDHCPQLVVESTPGVGHFHQLEAPERVNAILERFIASLDGSGR